MKRFLEFLAMVRKVFGYRVFIFGILAGIANTALISIINKSVLQSSANKIPSPWLFLAYAGALSIYFFLQYFYQSLLIKSAEKMILKNRTELVNRIRNCSLRKFEEIGNTRLFILLAQDTNTIGQAASLASNVIISLIVIVGSLIYLLTISAKGFLVTMGVLMLALIMALNRQKGNIRRIRHAIEMENRYLRYVRNLLDGIKEVKIDRETNNSMYALHIRPYMEDVSAAKLENNIFQARFMIFGQLIFFTFMGLVLFLLPTLHMNITDNPAQFVIILLYILPSIQALIPLLPQFSQIRTTMERLETAKSQLNEELQTTDEISLRLLTDQFQSLKIKDLTYSYAENREADNFTLGPIEMNINAGELIFIHGENGSGKSTLIKVITGLYSYPEGSIRLNDIPITAVNQQQYRNMFGVIFTDNHLLDYLYTKEEVSAEKIMQLLQITSLQQKVQFENNQFSTIELSAGQKKRIALVSLLVKDKPIYIFDEWTANQDPGFRNSFYNELIPALKEQGKTIIIITHDDSYLHMAEKLFKMKDGRLYASQSNIMPVPLN